MRFSTRSNSRVAGKIDWLPLVYSGMPRFIHTLIAAMLFIGCGTADPAIEVPAMREMKVVEVLPLETPWEDLENLLPNGDFGEWYAGAPVLRSFDFPGDPAISTVVRQVRERGNGALQRWHAPDAELPPRGLFRSTLRGLQPETSYEFEVSAIATDAVGAQACIGIWALRPSGATPLAVPLMRVEGVPGARVTRSASFTTQDAPLLIIGAYLDKAVPEEASILWLEWRLMRGETPVTDTP